MKRFVFVIDTDKYSGNFEREICAYLTGRYDQEYGSDTHGSRESKIAEQEVPAESWKYFENHVIDCLEEPDDLPIHTPVTIYPTPGWFNHGMGGHFKEGQEKEAFEDYKKEVKEYKEKHSSTLEARSKLQKCPAYQSVGIFFAERPSDAILQLLKERAFKFAKDYWPKQRLFGHPLEVTGFRLLEEQIKVVAKEEKV